MRNYLISLLALVALHAMAELPAPGTPGAPKDPRYCGEPERYIDGTIKRSAAALNAFAEENPCPLTLSGRTGCIDWQINHLRPLADGGCDTPINMWWFPKHIKTCREDWCIDRWERKYNAIPRQPVLLPPYVIGQ